MESKIDILLDMIDNTSYGDFCRVLRIVLWNIY